QESWINERYRLYKEGGSVEQTFKDGHSFITSYQSTSEGGTVAIRLDITERKKAEEELAASEERFRGLAEGSIQGIMVHWEQKPLFVNSAFAEMFGYAGAEDVLAHADSTLLFFSPEERERISTYAEARARGENPPSRYEARCIRKDATGFWVELMVTRVNWDGKPASQVAYADITERKRAEETLALSESRLTAFMNYAPAQAAFNDLEGRYLFVNKLFADVRGLEFDQIIGKTVREVYPDEQAEIVDREDRKVIETGQPSEVEMNLVTPGGGEHTYRVLRFPTFGPDNEMMALGTLYTDITKRKLAEAALEEAYEMIKDQKDRMEDELIIGREIQLSMIPDVFPPFPGHDEFSILATLDPAREVGGDFYDFFFVDDDRLCICIGDVSGKGVPAALFMAVTKTLIKSRAGDDASTASIITHVNDELSSDNSNSMFVTVFLAILNIKTGELVYTNAGHNPPYIKRNNGALERLSRRHGVVIGALEGQVYEEDTGMLDTGDLLFMYTDGVTEQTNEGGSLFSEKRLENLLSLKTVNSVDAAISTIHSKVVKFRSQSDQNDDITILAIQYLGNPPKKFAGDMYINIANKLSEISKVHAEFDRFAGTQGLSKKDGNTVKLVLEELLNNVISHAFQDNREHEINIHLKLARTRITATIYDDGIPFNPMGVQTPDISLPINQREVGGLGIHLIRKMAGTIDYQRRIDKNVMTVTVPRDPR
ncbi:MAG: SpoIIE family protein phosphatase, partial [SAR324 cluster bacterium]|nr:SpoIIE family protein phosphatase [SAR324 cluster bacterium]